MFVGITLYSEPAVHCLLVKKKKKKKKKKKMGWGGVGWWLGKGLRSGGDGELIKQDR